MLPFKIEILETDLQDLNDRLKNTRLLDAADSAWTRGPETDYLHEFLESWKEYDWRETESWLNEMPQYLTNVGNTRIHFFHFNAPREDAPCLLLLHGWPDSFYRYIRAAKILSKNFHVVLPSLPGFGFSGRTPMGSRMMGKLFLELLSQLNYNQAIVAGGDLGSLVAMRMAQTPGRIQGLHLTDAGYPDHTTDFSSLSAEEQEFAGFIQGWWMKEGAFSMVHSTKPRALSPALLDSPMGLAAWMLSMMSSLSDGPGLEQRISRDDLIANIMIYWLTRTASSSLECYFMEREDGSPWEIPSPAASVLHCELDAPLPEKWALRRTNLMRYSSLAGVGHFAAWEAPQEWAADLAGFVAELLGPQTTEGRPRILKTWNGTVLESNGANNKPVPCYPDCPEPGFYHYSYCRSF
ncbi:MAG: epoxide hydrolase [Leptospiraceae bacterium]|nr:epoxide hydrolase [Leptospiraceae bacterium]